MVGVDLCCVDVVGVDVRRRCVLNVLVCVIVVGDVVERVFWWSCDECGGEYGSCGCGGMK